jgi:hypothetical protein
MLHNLAPDYILTRDALRLLGMKHTDHWRIWELHRQGALASAPVEESVRRRWWKVADLIAYKRAYDARTAPLRQRGTRARQAV